MAAIRKQVEYYFSRANLNNDPFLVSQMNKEMFVPIDTIAGFKMMKNLTENRALIVEAVKSSTEVILDETLTKIRPNFTVSRNTVILRDIPSQTPIEVRFIFVLLSYCAFVFVVVVEQWTMDNDVGMTSGCMILVSHLIDLE